jgi:hypothetical protein
MLRLLQIMLLLALVMPTPLPARAAPSVTVGFGGNGLSSLRYGGQEFLWLNPDIGANGAFNGGAFWVSRVTLRGADGKDVSIEGGGPSQVSTDPASRIVTRTFAWGRVRGQFTPSGSHLGLALIVTNTTSDTTIQAIVLQPLWLKFPQKPTEYAQEYPLMTASRDEPGVVSASYGTGTLALCNEDIHQPLLIGFPFALDKPTDTEFPLRVSSGPENGPRDLLAPYLIRPIAPGRSDSYTLSLRFGPPGTTAASLTSDLDRRFAAAFPLTLHWPDRRPLGYLMLSSTVPHRPSGKNPRGWFNNADDVDVTSEAGRAAFAKRLTEYADNSIRILKAMNAQGMITWDIEGQEYPHATSYIGDPRKLAQLSPEMEPLADAYFTRFRRAGLKVGVCIRPQLLVKTADGGTSQHDQADMKQVTRTLIEKALYANKRWGCTLFYVDSNGDPNVPYPASVFQAVAAALASRKITVLLMPEHQNVRYYGVAAPYDELRGGVLGTPDRIRRVYPGAFTVLNTSDGDLDGRHADLVTAVKRGDILLFRAWFDDPQNAKVKAVYAEAGAGRAIIPVVAK